MATVDLAKTKNIQQIHKNVVYGYIRNVQNTVFSENNDPFYIIPKLIIRLCLLFWYEAMDEFDPKLCSKNMKISNDKKTVSMKTNGSSSCYGSIIIDSTIKNVEYIWKIKNIGDNAAVYIGIDNSNAKWTEDYFDNQHEKASYAYGLYLGKICQWNATKKSGAPRAKKGDIVTMILKFGTKKATLDIKVNDGDNFRICSWVMVA